MIVMDSVCLNNKAFRILQYFKHFFFLFFGYISNEIFLMKTR